ncbi:hypothetical protein RI119_18535 [Bacillus amyloliquefaciens]|uniref:hypothetical protein n=1 Tax=Bacillus amyloliquefaciens TaxID=1390 RepID=UPI0037577C5E
MISSYQGNSRGNGLSVVNPHFPDCTPYRVFNSKTLFGMSGRKYFYKWEMARLDEEIILMIKENEAEKNKVN